MAIRNQRCRIRDDSFRINDHDPWGAAGPVLYHGFGKSAVLAFAGVMGHGHIQVVLDLVVP